MVSEGQSEPAPRKMTRRDFLKITAIGSGVAGAALLGLSRCDPQDLLDLVKPKEPASTTPIDFGFNTHMRVKHSERENLTVEQFMADVDLMRSRNQTALRFNLRNGDVILGGDTESIEWDEEALKKYDEAIDYAKKSGMNIYFVTNVPEYAKDYSLEDYKKVTRLFYRELAERYEGKIEMWQIFNEPDVHHYTDYHSIQGLPQEYLSSLGEIVKTASDSLKEIDPTAKTTVNASHWVGSGRNLGLEEALLFGAVEESIDALTLDFYHDDNVEAIRQFPVNYIGLYKELYGKDIIIGELGLPTYGRFSQEDQRKYVSMALDAMKGARVRPKAILLYELRDEVLPDDQTNDVERNFGFLGVDGQPKPAFESVLERMQPEKRQVPNTTPLMQSLMERLQRRFPTKSSHHA